MKKSTRRIIGRCLIANPFVAIATFGMIYIGVVGTLICFTVGGIIIAVVYTGVKMSDQ